MFIAAKSTRGEQTKRAIVALTSPDTVTENASEADIIVCDSWHEFKVNEDFYRDKYFVIYDVESEEPEYVTVKIPNYCEIIGEEERLIGLSKMSREKLDIEMSGRR